MSAENSGILSAPAAPHAPRKLAKQNENATQQHVDPDLVGTLLLRKFVSTHARELCIVEGNESKRVSNRNNGSLFGAI